MNIDSITCVKPEPGTLYVIECDRRLNQASRINILNDWIELWKQAGVEPAPPVACFHDGVKLTETEA